MESLPLCGGAQESAKIKRSAHGPQPRNHRSARPARSVNARMRELLPPLPLANYRGTAHLHPQLCYCSQKPVEVSRTVFTGCEGTTASVSDSPVRVGMALMNSASKAEW